MRTLLLLVICGAICVMQTQAQPVDGNPHHWDRKRRCDQWPAFDPPCGSCEGYGGIAYGDLPDQINMTTCEKVENPVDPDLRIRPIWDIKHFTQDQHVQLIGSKIDPGCRILTPTNSSAGPLCYSALEKNNITYDMSLGGPRARRSDKDLGGGSSKFGIHQGINSFSVKRQADGQTSCSCFQFAQPYGDIYPIQYNFTQNLFYQGRERIGVEIPETTPVQHTIKEVDHWSFGPHHFWAIPQTGVVVRSYQPYNGLQLWGTTKSSYDPALLATIPPMECKKSGSVSRRGCGDDGYPNASATVGSKLQTMPKDTNTNTPRAIQVVPRPQFRGDSFSNMSNTLNQWLLQSTQAKSCDQFSATELQELSAMVHELRDERLDLVYQKVTDNRRLRGDLSDMQKTWARLNAVVEGHAEHEKLHRIQRDGHCHEVVMWYVHHLSEDVKQVLRETGVEMPLLSGKSHGPECEPPLDSALQQVCQNYKEVVTCQSCHSNVAPPAH